MKLNAEAKAFLREVGVSQAAYFRYWGDGTRWTGDACGCPDDRCMDGFHHDPEEKCYCLHSSIAEMGGFR